MKRLLIVLVTGVCLSPALLAGVARADSTVTVGFDDLANGSTVTTQYEASDGLYFQGSAGGSQDGVTPTVVANHAARSAPQHGADQLHRLRRARRTGRRARVPRRVRHRCQRVRRRARQRAGLGAASGRHRGG